MHSIQIVSLTPNALSKYYAKRALIREPMNPELKMIKKDLSRRSLEVVSNMRISWRISAGRQLIDAIKYPKMARTYVCVLQKITTRMV